MIAKTQTIEGVTSLLPDGNHMVMWDLEQCTLKEAEKTLRSSPTINQGSPGWIDCGTCATQFSYIKLQTVPDGVYTIYIDSVKVQP